MIRARWNGEIIAESNDATSFYANPSAEASNIENSVAFWQGVTVETEA